MTSSRTTTSIYLAARFRVKYGTGMSMVLFSRDYAYCFLLELGDFLDVFCSCTAGDYWTVS
jgi:hypothetical protein